MKTLKHKVNTLIFPFVPTFIANKYLFSKWKRNGMPVPPPHIVKQKVIAYYQQKFGYKTLIETGTYLGAMLEAQKNNFKKIISIELGVELYEKAVKKFKNYKHITIVQGDSGKVMPSIMKNINEPAIFWLDGHYSEGVTARGEKDCPIYEEIDAIFANHNYNHILLIDDARHFVGVNDYPTIEDLTNYVKSKDSEYYVEVKDDIIRFVKKL